MKKYLYHLIIILSLVTVLFSCKKNNTTSPFDGMSDTTLIRSDSALYLFITQTQPFASYTLFPNADSVTSGTLNGSNAHRPLVRVSMNATALNALRNDTLPMGTSFPKGSVVFKQIIENGQTTLFALIYKDPNNSLSAGGWLWSELYPEGRVAYSIANKGSGCIGCHSFGKGLQNDLIRTFERQHR
jgi:hypothetical protein